MRTHVGRPPLELGRDHQATNGHPQSHCRNRALGPTSLGAKRTTASAARTVGRRPLAMINLLIASGTVASTPGCTAPPGKQSSDMPGGDLRSDPLASELACAAACCKNYACVGWVFAASAPTAFGGCSKGAPCCYLKAALSSPRPATCCSSGSVSRQTTRANVSIDAAHAIAHTSAALVSFNLDWHKNSEEMPAWSHNASAMHIDLTSPRLRAAVSALAPAYLRIGGSEGDRIVYDVDGDGCGPKSGAPQPVDPAFCLSMSRWRELTAFAAECGVSLVFGLNAMSFRPNASAQIDMHNIDAFLHFTAAASLQVAGFELGNELPHIPAVVSARDFQNLAALLARYWPDRATRPKLIGNDLNSDEGYVRAFLPLVGASLDALTYHNYAGEGANHTPIASFMTAEYLDRGPLHAKGVIDAWRSLAAPATELWVGEIAACWHSRQQGWTDRFGDLFWYLDALAARAALNHSAFCRQALVGGFYEMLDRGSFAPNPDYYGALLFRQLMGTTVLRATVDGTGAGSEPPSLRVWAQCQTPGVVTLLFINLSDERLYEVPVDTLSLPGAREAPRYDYELSADSLTAQSVKLNGVTLQTGPDGSIPSLTDLKQSATGEGTIRISPHTLHFVVFLDLAAAACYPSTA